MSCFTAACSILSAISSLCKLSLCSQQCSFSSQRCHAEAMLPSQPAPAHLRPPTWSRTAGPMKPCTSGLNFATTLQLHSAQLSNYNLCITGQTCQHPHSLQPQPLLQAQHPAWPRGCGSPAGLAVPAKVRECLSKQHVFPLCTHRSALFKDLRYLSWIMKTQHSEPCLHSPSAVHRCSALCHRAAPPGSPCAILPCNADVCT